MQIGFARHSAGLCMGLNFKRFAGKNEDLSAEDFR